jgi:hypothetical protein
MVGNAAGFWEREETMSEGSPSGPWAQFLHFCKRVAVAVGFITSLTLVLWAVTSMLEGAFGSPAGALLLGAAFSFVLAVLPFFYDILATLALPLRVIIQKKTARELLQQDRPRSETGISLTFVFFVAGLVLLLLSFVAGRIWGG